MALIRASREAGQRAAGRHWALVLAVIILFTGMVGLTVVESVRSYHSTIERAEIDTRNLAAALEHFTIGVFNRAKLSLDEIFQVIAHQPPGRTLPPRQLYDMALRLKQSIPEIDVMGLADANGDYIANSAVEPESDGKAPRKISIADRDYFKRHKIEPHAEYIISGPFAGRTTGNMVMILSRRLPSNDGSFKGITLCSISLDVFSGTFARITKGDESVVSLLDNDRILLARYPYKKDAVGMTIPSYPELSEVVRQGQKEATFTAISPLDDVVRIASYRRLEGLPFHIIVGKSRWIILAGWKRTLILTLFLEALIIIVSILALLRYRRELEIFENQRALSLQSAKMSSLGEMASGMAHEINNPLAIIVGRASQMLRALNSSDSGAPDPAYLRAQTEKIIDTANRIARIIRGLRGIARNADSDPMDSVELKTIVENVLELAAERFRTHSIRLEVSEIPSTRILCRETQIAQVLLNLLNNAYDAIYELPEKWIRMEFRQEGSRVTLSVTDSGQGIAPDVAEKIMQPFFTTKDVGKGTGLGLSISKSIIEEHGGRFYLDQGSTNTRFVIELPTT